MKAEKFYMPVMIMNDKQAKLTKNEVLYRITVAALMGALFSTGIMYWLSLVQMFMKTIVKSNYQIKNLIVVVIAVCVLIIWGMLVKLYSVSLSKIKPAFGWGHFNKPMIEMKSSDPVEVDKIIDQEKRFGLRRLKRLNIFLLIVMVLQLLSTWLETKINMVDWISMVFSIATFAYCLLELWRNQVVIPLVIQVGAFEKVK